MVFFVLQLVVLLVILGGIIAYVGNYVGHLIGKKRLTLFNLRPRYTAITITIISGSLIALITLLIVLLISQDARTALLGLEGLKKQIKISNKELAVTREELSQVNKLLAERYQLQLQLEKSLDEAKSEITVLQATRDKLTTEIKTAREGQLLFRVGQVISLSLIQAGPESDKLEKGLNQIILDAENYLSSLGLKADKKLIINVPPEDFNQTVYNLMEDKKLYIVKLVASRNILWGEDIPVHFELQENKLVYHEGEDIAEIEISARLSASEAEGEITNLLKLVHQTAREAGIVPDPSGSVGSVPYAQIYDLAKKLKGGNRVVILKGQAAKSLYTIGPLEIKFKTVNK